MKKIVICLMSASMAFAKEPQVNKLTNEVPENRLDQNSMWGVKMGAAYDEAKGMYSLKHETPQKPSVHRRNPRSYAEYQG